MPTKQFAQQVDNSTTDNAVFTEAEITANTSNQLDVDFQNEDASAGFETGETNISGATETAIGLKSQDGSTFSVTFEWTDGAGNTLFTESPSEWQGVTEASGLLTVKSTHLNVKISGTSTDVDGTVNAH